MKLQLCVCRQSGTHHALRSCSPSLRLTFLNGSAYLNSEPASCKCVGEQCSMCSHHIYRSDANTLVCMQDELLGIFCRLPMCQFVVPRDKVYRLQETI